MDDARDKRGVMEPQIVIVGAGPAGLALAIELGTRSIPCLLIERNERAGYSPRAKTTNVRTREHLRRWGIASRLAAASPFGVDYPSNILFVTRLSGNGIARFEHALSCSPQRDSRYSEHSQWIPQYKLESVLLEHARSLASVEIQFSQEFIDFDQDADEVRVRVRDATRGAERVIRAKYLVGADGARSGSAPPWSAPTAYPEITMRSSMRLGSRRRTSMVPASCTGRSTGTSPV